MPHGVSPCMQTVRGGCNATRSFTLYADSQRRMRCHTEFHPVCRQSKEDAMPHGVSSSMQTVKGGCNATRSFIQYAEDVITNATRSYTLYADSQMMMRCHTEFHPVCSQRHGVSPCMQTVKGGCNATRSFTLYADSQRRM